MRASTLTDVTIKNLKPRVKQYEIFDSSFPGFGIRIAPGGAKSFVVLYRHHGRPRRLTLGRYPVLSLSDARQQAKAALAQVASGVDPALEKLTKRENMANSLFPNVVARFLDEYAVRNTRSWDQTRDILRRNFESVWRHTSVEDVTKHMVQSRLSDLVLTRGESAANRGFAELRKFFNWCIRLDLVTHSPCAGLRMPCRTKSRDRVLTDGELSSIWCAAGEMGHPFGHLVRLLILTGQRRGEVSALNWTDVDRSTCLWQQHTNKSARVHLVPMTREALSVLDAVPRLHDALVFPSRKLDRPLSGYSKWKADLDKRSGVRSWTLHDIRRTVATGMAILGVQLPVIELVLNHTSTQLTGVAKVYNRFDYLKDRRAALESWARHVQNITSESVPNALCPQNCTSLSYAPTNL